MEKIMRQFFSTNFPEFCSVFTLKVWYDMIVKEEICDG